VAQYVLERLVEGISTALAELPPEVAGDIYDRGIILTGGGALFGGMEEYMRDEPNASTDRDEPRYAIVRGLEQMFDEPLWLRHVIRSEPHPLLDAQSESFEL